MGWGTKALSFFTGVDTSAIATKSMGMLSNGLDMLVLTEEEKIQYNQKKSELWFKWAEQQKDENSLRSRARREIALLIVKTELGLTWLTAFAYVVGDQKNADFLFKLSTATMGTAFVAVIVFYFGGYYAEKITKKK